MRQMFLLLSVLLLGLSWAVAQNTTPSTSSPATSSGQSAQTSSGSTGEKTVEGCLSGSAGSYTLTDKNGMTWQLTGDTSKLSEHVGHEVKVMGTATSASSTGTETAGGAAGSAGSQALQVTSVKHISKTCKGGAGMSH